MVLQVSTSDAKDFFIAPTSARHSAYFAEWSAGTVLELPPQPFLRSTVVGRVVQYLDHYSPEAHLPPFSAPQAPSCRADFDDILTIWEKEEFLPSLVPVRLLADVVQCAEYLDIPRLVVITAAALAWYFHTNPASLRAPNLFQ